MGKRAIDRELWDGLVDAFDRKGVNFAAVSSIANCDARTAKRAWETGWPKKGLPAIGVELERRAEAAREARKQFERERALREQELREAERQTVLRRNAQEEKLSTSARVNAITLQHATSNLLLVAVPLAEELLAAQKAGTLSGLKPSEKARLVRDTALIMRMANETAERALRVERLRTSTGAIADDKPPIDLPTAVEYLQGIETTIRRAHAINMKRSSDGESFERDTTDPLLPVRRGYDA